MNIAPMSSNEGFVYILFHLLLLCLENHLEKNEVFIPLRYARNRGGATCDSNVFELPNCFCAALVQP